MSFKFSYNCPVDICEKRDQKGIYAKAKSGAIKDFTGISSPYEIPEKPDKVIQSDKEDANSAAERVLDLLKQKQLI